MTNDERVNVLQDKVSRLEAKVKELVEAAKFNNKLTQQKFEALKKEIADLKSKAPMDYGKMFNDMFEARKTRK